MTSSLPYDPAKFRDGSMVRVASRSALEEFIKTWKWHNKLRPEQLEYAGKIAKIEKSFMYHGGDILYQLENVPGIWHERNLEPMAAA